MFPSVVVVNPKVKHINTIQVLAAMLKFRNLFSPPGKYKCHNICRFFFFFFQGLHGSYHGQHKTHFELFDAYY